MCTILMSINPEHVDNIISGKKKYEYRRQKSKRIPDTIVIYSTSPVQKIVGEVKVKKILEDSPELIWNRTANSSGISKEFFKKYFKGKKQAIAYKLGKFNKYKKPITLKSFGIESAPQSFIYLD